MTKKVKRKTKKVKQAKKKATPKTIVHVTIKKKVLGKAPEEYSFSLSDGRKLQSVYELVDELETMSEDMFRDYVSEHENHFANWVENVFGEKTLADEMREMHDRLDTQRALLKKLVRELTKHVKA